MALTKNIRGTEFELLVQPAPGVKYYFNQAQRFYFIKDTALFESKGLPGDMITKRVFSDWEERTMEFNHASTAQGNDLVRFFPEDDEEWTPLV